MPTQRKQYRPLDPAGMARACYQLAKDMRREHAMGWGPIRTYRGLISRLDAADDMDTQGTRWEREVETGVPNHTDRSLIGW